MTSSSGRPDPHQGAERRGDTLVVGDDSVSHNAVRHLVHRGDIVFVRRDDVGVDLADEHAHKTLDVDRITDLFRGEIDISPNAAIIATSQDSQNLMIVVHLQREFDIEQIAVRVNDPQYIDAFAGLSVDIVDVADVVGSALAQKLAPSTSAH